MFSRSPTRTRVAPLALLAICVAVLLSAPGALAAKCAPPGVSGVDQYTESVPGPGCNRPTSGPGSGGSGHGGGHLPPGTSQQLASQGAAGRAVQQLVATSGAAGSSGQAVPGNGNSPGPGSAHGGKAGQGNRGLNVNAPDVSGRGLISALLHPILSGSTSGGAGILLPIFLAVVLGLGVAAIVRRRRQVSS